MRASIPPAVPLALDFNPIRQVAAFEAWLGSEDKYLDELFGVKLDGRRQASQPAATVSAALELEMQEG